MFTRARLHLTLVYVALLGVTVVLVAGAIGVLAVREARNTDDRELQIRASAIAAAIPLEPPPPPSASPGPPSRGPDGRSPPLEQEGLLEFTIHVTDGRATAPSSSSPSGLPNLPAAQQAIQNGAGRYLSTTLEGGQVRIYSLPVVRSGRIVAVVQVARSRYFVNAAVTRLALVSLAAGLIGLALSAAAGYWLAGRTLRPIAAALDRQRAFAADASHELRTPLTVLLTNAEFLTRHVDAGYQDVVQDSIAEIERLNRLVTELLMLARADQGKAVLAMSPVSLSEVGGNVARQFQPLAAAKGLKLETDIAPTVMVSGDQDRLQQLAVILVDNAVRYTAQGTIAIRVAQDGDGAVLAVSDTGMGIAPEHLPHLFERFYRTDAARSAEDGGTGLGLALAEWITHSHHGRIDVVSTPGQGSTFSAHLPASRSADRGHTKTPAAASPPGGANAAGGGG